jgi:MarR family transcriptional regulator for hemolysin
MGDEPAPVGNRPLVYQVNLAARTTRALLDERLAGQGITFSTWVSLIALATRGPLIQRDLAGIVDVEGPTMVRRLDQLEAAGLVQRSPSPGDRRATEVSLTEQGRELFERVRNAVRDTETELFEGLDEQDVEIAHRLLVQITERARDLRGR